MHRKSGRNAAIVVFLIVMTIVGTYWQTVRHLVESNDNRWLVFLVLGVLLAAIWCARRELDQHTLEPFPLGLLALFAAGAAWLAAELVFVRVLAEFAIIAMIPIAVATIIGTRAFLTLSFPLLFLFFAMPIGGPIVPILVEWTANISVAALQASSIPVHRDGAYLLIPTGSWAIADTCSGIAFLNTCLMLGSLYAWTMYRSAVRRLLFMVGAICVGIAGNWVRVYLTIVIAHLSENRFLRDDHETHGWIVFAVMMSLYGWVGLRFQETKPPMATTSVDEKLSKRQKVTNGIGRTRFLVTSLATFLILACWPLLDLRLAQSIVTQPDTSLNLVAHRDWRDTRNPDHKWVPLVLNPRQVQVQSFIKDRKRVTVYAGIFQKQSWNSKLVSSVNRLAETDDPSWKLIARGNTLTKIGGETVSVGTGIVVGHGERILAWHWYWMPHNQTSSNLSAKLDHLWSRLMGNDDTSAWVAVYTDANDSSAIAAESLANFLREFQIVLQPPQ